MNNPCFHILYCSFFHVINNNIISFISICLDFPSFFFFFEFHVVAKVCRTEEDGAAEEVESNDDTERNIAT